MFPHMPHKYLRILASNTMSGNLSDDTYRVSLKQESWEPFGQSLPSCPLLFPNFLPTLRTPFPFHPSYLLASIIPTYCSPVARNKNNSSCKLTAAAYLVTDEYLCAYRATENAGYSPSARILSRRTGELGPGTIRMLLLPYTADWFSLHT